MALTNFITLIVGKLLPINDVLWFTGLAFIGGLVVTKIGYYLMEKYKISSVVIFIVIGLAVANLIAGIWYPIVESERFGFEVLVRFNLQC
jgi:hypothetical protein